MSLYKLKHFLTFHDVVDYLIDKEYLKGYDKNLKVKDFLTANIQIGLITPVIYLQRECIAWSAYPPLDFYNDFCDAEKYSDEQAKEFSKLGEVCFLDGYFSIGRDIVLHIFQQNELELEFHDLAYTKVYKINEFCYVPIRYEPYFLTSHSVLPTNNPVFFNVEIAEHEKISFDQLLYPKSQIEIILNNEIDHLKSELTQAQALLAEKPKNMNNDQLAKLFDEQGEYYAPDLAHAVNLWLDLYANGKQKDDSHTNLAKQWINKNTGYKDEQGGFDQAEKRIRETTTPLKEWASSRNKNYKK